MNPDRKILDNDDEPFVILRPLVWLLILGSMAAFWGTVGLWVLDLVR